MIPSEKNAVLVEDGGVSICKLKTTRHESLYE